MPGGGAAYGQSGAWVLSSAAFGLLHGLTIFTGQALGQTVQQILLAFVSGSGFYLIRRMTGLLVVCMVIHGLWDFSSFIGSGRGDTADDIPAGVVAAPFMYGAVIAIIAVLVITFRRRGGTSEPAPAGA